MRILWYSDSTEPREPEPVPSEYGPTIEISRPALKTWMDEDRNESEDPE